MSDREALLALYAFLTTKQYVTMDGDSLHDMVTRYQNPPLTALNTVAMQMTTKEYNALSVVDIREDGNRAAFGDYWQKQYKWLMS